MKELNISKSIITKRKEKGITQDDLAAYIGVSKASVSKWETGQSYPDITFLPLLATYFNISIDELIGYSPQMTKEDIKKLYHRLSSDFSTLPFNEVIATCHTIIKKYYSCFPLLLQIAVLFLNHYNLAKEQEQPNLVKEIVDLCVRIKTESNDIWLSKQANSLEAMSYMILQKPQAVLELLEGTIKPIISDETQLANAYYLMGEINLAKSVLQISTYQHLLQMLGAFPTYLLLHVNEKDKFKEIVKRATAIIEVFEIDTLHPNTAAQIYFAISQGYAIQNEKEAALDALHKYAFVCTTKFFPLTLHGDAFFDSLEDWFLDFDLGLEPPRDEKLIKTSMIQAIETNPNFDILREHPRYKNILKTMIITLGGN